ncbi:tRNA 5-methoxyuridine(34)/uridine 5-oxyacetic acid(34) synthase CmoB [Lentisphaerota bacterium ZTH]|nr:tRNA 5-methoxyuridine(34)/uridine 5-oxyacetic acid(34) synthase CmoB [Lentisphaerota bacterium]WET07401.1 tRNA 5-methoxyuridine(34)/uridine 5-oxyacetic acid(34) synthase CmoB [Lentisphaerota bacterium ZTH]
MIIGDYSDFKKLAEQTPLAPWAEAYANKSQQAMFECNHGHLDMWLEAIRELPEIKLSNIDMDSDTIRAGVPADCDNAIREQLYDCMQKLRPWRKGPFEICGMKIETEWRSDWKWNRLKNHIASLKNRTVLDIGCGSGYHCWRMAAAGAKLAAGIDPYKVFIAQFWAMKKYLNDNRAWVLPLGVEDLPTETRCFDTVFSMGVLYHRKSPLDHLLQIRDLLRPGGELVLETLVIDGGENAVLVPEGRYAKMRNVWFLPSCAALEKWLRKLGFENVRTVNVTRTSVDEQRTTDWMRWESLKDYIDPENPAVTIEGYQAPTRAIIIANTQS